MKKVYLSGRMSGLSTEEWRKRFKNVENTMKHFHCVVVNPAETVIARHPWLYRVVGYRMTLWYDLRLLKRCTHIFMVGPGWRDSRGARLERMKAREWGIEEMAVTGTGS